MQNLKHYSAHKTSLLNRDQFLPGQNKSLQISNHQAAAHLGQGREPTSDPKGRVLRYLRLSQGLDPTRLATEACISLAQLYEIEKGLGTLFYSTTMREQAARRIAQILGTDWHRLPEISPLHLTTDNVIHLQRHAAIQAHVEKARCRIDPLIQETRPSGFSRPDSLAGNVNPQAVAPFLSIPCADEVEHTPLCVDSFRPNSKSKKRSGLWLLLFCLGLVCTASLMAMYGYTASDIDFKARFLTIVT